PLTTACPHAPLTSLHLKIANMFPLRSATSSSRALASFSSDSISSAAAVSTPSPQGIRSRTFPASLATISPSPATCGLTYDCREACLGHTASLAIGPCVLAQSPARTLDCGPVRLRCIHSDFIGAERCSHCDGHTGVALAEIV